MQLRNTILVGALAICIVAKVEAQPLRIVDNLPGTFIDISQTGGTPLMLGDDQEVVVVGTDIGNAVFPTDSIVVANNGGLGFRNPPSNDLAPLNGPIPSSTAFGGGQAALAFWDDIDDKEGDVFYAKLKDRIVVQWNNRNIAGTPNTATFQIQIFGASAGGSDTLFAQFLYVDIEQPVSDGGVSATIGYQDGGSGFGDFEWSSDIAGAVRDGTVLSLVPAKSRRIPVASYWGLGMLAVIIVAAGTVVMHRRHRRPHTSY